MFYDQFAFLIQIPYKTNDSIRFMILCPVHFCPSSVFKKDYKIGIQISRLMETAFDLIRCKPGFFKDFRIRKKIYTCSGLLCFSQCRKKPVFQFNNGNSSFKSVMVNISFSFNLNIQIRRERIYNRRTYPMKSSTGFIDLIIKLSAGMKCGKHKALCRHPLFMHSHRNTTSIVIYRCRTVFFQKDLYPVTGTCQMFIHRIIYDLINQVVQSLSGYTSNIHSRSLTDCFQPFKNRNTASIISCLFCHNFQLLLVWLTHHMDIDQVGRT